MEAKLDEQVKRTRGRPSSGETELIEDELLQGALQEFLCHGYGGTSLTQIIKSLGISKTTLYSRYASKAELFQAIMTGQIEKLTTANVVFLPGGAELSLEEGLRTFALHTLSVSFEGDLLNINRLIFSESQRFPELGIAAAARVEKGVAQLAEFIRKCALRDGIPCRKPKDIAASFVFMLRGWYVNNMLTNEPVSKLAMKRFAAQAVHTVLSSREKW